jgi:hypothetical protein
MYTRPALDKTVPFRLHLISLFLTGLGFENKLPSTA